MDVVGMGRGREETVILNRKLPRASVAIRYVLEQVWLRADIWYNTSYFFREADVALQLLLFCMWPTG